jgi:transcriptional regulator with XRE-family HTH domain
MEMSKRVRAARNAVNMSLTQFAKASQIGRSTLVRSENGERKVPDAEIERMAHVSGFPTGFFTAPDLAEALGDGPVQAGSPTSQPAIWLALGELSVRLENLEANGAVKRRAGAIDPTHRAAAVQHLQALVRTLQAQALPPNQGEPDAAGGSPG